MPLGTYRTAAGSTLTVSGKHAGRFVVEFDWLEEGGCIECEAQATPDDDRFLVWHCDYCGGGSAAWMPVEARDAQD